MTEHGQQTLDEERKLGILSQIYEVRRTTLAEFERVPPRGM